MYIVEPGEIAEDDKSLYNAEIKSVKTQCNAMVSSLIAQQDSMTALT